MMILEQMKTCMYEHRRFKELLKRLYVAVTIMNYGNIIATVKFKVQLVEIIISLKQQS